MEIIHEERMTKYDLEDILQMLGGYDYFTPDQVHYVFLKLNGRVEEAQAHYDICMQHAVAMDEKAKKMRDAAELEKAEPSRDDETEATKDAGVSDEPLSQ
jgi:hypothetical protein